MGPHKSMQTLPMADLGDELSVLVCRDGARWEIIVRGAGDRRESVRLWLSPDGLDDVLVLLRAWARKAKLMGSGPFGAVSLAVVAKDSTTGQVVMWGEALSRTPRRAEG